MRPAGRSFRSRTARTHRSTRGPLAARGRPVPYRRCLPALRSRTSPTSRSTRRCLDAPGWVIPNSRANSVTGRSPARSSTRISRRWDSAIALKTSDVVAARAMAPSYAHISIRQAWRNRARTAVPSRRMDVDPRSRHVRPGLDPRAIAETLWDDVVAARRVGAAVLRSGGHGVGSSRAFEHGRRLRADALSQRAAFEADLPGVPLSRGCLRTSPCSAWSIWAPRTGSTPTASSAISWRTRAGRRADLCAR